MQILEPWRAHAIPYYPLVEPNGISVYWSSHTGSLSCARNCNVVLLQHGAVGTTSTTCASTSGLGPPSTLRATRLPCEQPHAAWGLRP